MKVDFSPDWLLTGITKSLFCVECMDFPVLDLVSFEPADSFNNLWLTKLFLIADLRLQPESEPH